MKWKVGDKVYYHTTANGWGDPIKVFAVVKAVTPKRVLIATMRGRAVYEFHTSPDKLSRRDASAVSKLDFLR